MQSVGFVADPKAEPAKAAAPPPSGDDSFARWIAELEAKPTPPNPARHLLRQASDLIYALATTGSPQDREHAFALYRISNESYSDIGVQRRVLREVRQALGKSPARAPRKPQSRARSSLNGGRPRAGSASRRQTEPSGDDPPSEPPGLGRAAPPQAQLPGFPSPRKLAGLRQGTLNGPAELLSQLVLLGLKREHRPAAAALVLQLDRDAHERLRGSAPTERSAVA